MTWHWKIFGRVTGYHPQTLPASHGASTAALVAWDVSWMLWQMSNDVQPTPCHTSLRYFTITIMTITIIITILSQRIRGPKNILHPQHPGYLATCHLPLQGTRLLVLLAIQLLNLRRHVISCGPCGTCGTCGTGMWIMWIMWYVTARWLHIWHEIWCASLATMCIRSRRLTVFWLPLRGRYVWWIIFRCLPHQHSAGTTFAISAIGHARNGACNGGSIWVTDVDAFYQLGFEC